MPGCLGHDWNNLHRAVPGIDRFRHPISQGALNFKFFAYLLPHLKCAGDDFGWFNLLASLKPHSFVGYNLITGILCVPLLQRDDIMALRGIFVERKITIQLLNSLAVGEWPFRGKCGERNTLLLPIGGLLLICIWALLIA